jgi:DNA-binding phage protein
MAKTKILRKQKKSAKSIRSLHLKKSAHVIDYSPTQELLDETLVRNAIWECLKNNDSAGVMEVLAAYFETMSKEPLCQKHSLARSTFYHSFKGKNPTLKTLAKLVSASNRW